MDFFSDAMRRDPYPVYEQMRRESPVFRIPPPFDAWAVFDDESVRRVLTEHQLFSSAVPAPRRWFLFMDPPEHTKLRGLISRAFIPGVIAGLDARIRELSRSLLDEQIERGEMDLATDYALPLPMMVIAEMIGIARDEWARFTRWSEVILSLSLSRSGGEAGENALRDFATVTVEMSDYLTEMIAQRRSEPRNDLLTRLMKAEVDGGKLGQEEILGFFQLLLLGGQETTANLINNSILCLAENPDQLGRLRSEPALVPLAIEEVLRFRSPLQWMMRTPRTEVEVHGETIPAGALVLAMIGSANRDPKRFPDPERFDILRQPNPHLAFGQGIHSCLGAALSRLEARIALGDLLQRLDRLTVPELENWEPRPALHVLGPSRLRIRFEPGRRTGVG